MRLRPAYSLMNSGPVLSPLRRYGIQHCIYCLTSLEHRAAAPDRVTPTRAWSCFSRSVQAGTVPLVPPDCGSCFLALSFGVFLGTLCGPSWSVVCLKSVFPYTARLSVDPIVCKARKGGWPAESPGCSSFCFLHAMYTVLKFFCK